MNFEDLIGQKFLERTFLEMIHSDMQEHFDAFAGLHVHIYFTRPEGGVPDEIQITEVHRFENNYEMDQVARKIIEKREWFEVFSACDSRTIILCRLDRSGWLGNVLIDGRAWIQRWAMGWLPPPDPNRKPMTQEEIRQAFRELAGLMSEETELQKLNSKRSA